MIATHTAGDGPAVLWIHGYTMDSSTWQPLWDRLPGWRHVGVDLPGHGASAPMPPGITLPAMAAEIVHVAKDNSAQRLVALSFGSCIALQVAIDEPDLLTHVVLGAPTIAGAPADPQAERRYRELAMLKRFRSGRADGRSWMRSPPDIFRGTERHAAVQAALREVIVKHQWDELDSGAMRSLTNHVHTPADLGRIGADTLVVTGDDDMPTFVANAETLRSTVERCHALPVPHAGHLPLLEQPDAVAAAIDAHLRRKPL